MLNRAAYPTGFWNVRLYSPSSDSRSCWAAAYDSALAVRGDVSRLDNFRDALLFNFIKNRYLEMLKNSQIHMALNTATSESD